MTTGSDQATPPDGLDPRIEQMAADTNDASALRLRVGCPMWANRAWVGPYFPSSTPTGDELRTYVTWCNTVEGNTTFYAVPKPEVVDRWAEGAPAGFTFCFKLPRHITHERRLRNIAEPLAEFLDVLAPLHDRLGPLQIQLPASFGPSDLPVLAELLTHLPSDFDWALEVRHPEFFAGGEAERPLNDLLASHSVNRVILDSRALFTRPPETREEHEAWENKPRVPVRPVATGHQPLIRLIGQRSPEENLAHWQPWVDQLVKWLEAGIEPHVFTHTPDNAIAPQLARDFFDLVAATGVDVAPLPTPAADTDDTEQLDLFEPVAESDVD